MKSSTLRSGFTLPEVLVTSGIFAIACSLVLSATQSTRESARRIDCINRLRQLGLAARQSLAEKGSFPRTTVGREVQLNKVENLSPHVALVPYLGMSRDLVLAATETEVEDRPLDISRFPSGDARLDANVSVFLCPSDRLHPSGSNFRANMGAWFLRCSCTDKQGSFSIWRNIRESQFVDGTSNTVLFSERPQGDHLATAFDGSRDIWVIDEFPDSCAPDTNAKGTDVYPCKNSFLGHDSYAGNVWFIGGFRNSWYNHVLPPNSLGHDLESWHAHGVDAVVTARSLHTGGVNIVFASGSARFVSDSIDVNQWKALGTRAGNEAISLSME
jgi:prepilin-type N-terminal cleavage/methylation domain-containing protein